MANRPVFIPNLNGFPFVRNVDIEFEWYPGFAKVQAQKSIASLHEAAAKVNIFPILEISSKSTDRLGVSLSAFNLMLNYEGQYLSVECAYQGSKVFQKGGPYSSLYRTSSREAKTDERLRTSGDLVAYNFVGEDFPINPVTAFYDWLYLTALSQNVEPANRLLEFKGFSDIAFNPKKSLNCQARAAALFVSLHQSGCLKRAVEDREYYITLITNKMQTSPVSRQSENKNEEIVVQLKLPLE